MQTITINPNLTNRLKSFGGTPELLVNLFVDAKLKEAREPSESSEVPELTQSRLKELLDYNAETGIFTWKVNKGRVKAGSVAGTDNGDGYRRIGIDGNYHLEHRLAFLFMTGEMPKAGMDVDHRNGIKDDNRFSNLRVVTKSVNLQNQRKAQRNNLSTGIPNVYPSGKGFRVMMKVDGKQKYFGTYDTMELAGVIARFVKRLYHPGCTI